MTAHPVEAVAWGVHRSDRTFAQQNPREAYGTKSNAEDRAGKLTRWNTSGPPYTVVPLVPLSALAAVEARCEKAEAVIDAAVLVVVRNHEISWDEEPEGLTAAIRKLSDAIDSARRTLPPPGAPEVGS